MAAIHEWAEHAIMTVLEEAKINLAALTLQPFAEVRSPDVERHGDWSWSFPDGLDVDEGEGHSVVLLVQLLNADICVSSGEQYERMYTYPDPLIAMYSALLWQGYRFAGEPPDGWVRRWAAGQETQRRRDGLRASTVFGECPTGV